MLTQTLSNIANDSDLRMGRITAKEWGLKNDVNEKTFNEKLKTIK
jgi:hypothetical protein